MPNGQHHQVLIVGGGTAGITVAAILRGAARGPRHRDRRAARQALLPAGFHSVGAGVYALARPTPGSERDAVGRQWIRGAAKIRAREEHGRREAATRSPTTIWWSAPA